MTVPHVGVRGNREPCSRRSTLHGRRRPETTAESTRFQTGRWVVRFHPALPISGGDDDGSDDGARDVEGTERIKSAISRKWMEFGEYLTVDFEVALDGTCTEAICATVVENDK